MSDPVIQTVAGLQLSNNTFSASPPGSLSKALNGVISQKGVFEPRNGQDRLAATPAAPEIPFALGEFQQAILASYSESKTDPYELGFRSGVNITPYDDGPYNPVDYDGATTDYARMKFLGASLFLHFCCADGPRTLETYNDLKPRRSGLSRVPDLLMLMRQATGTQVGPIPYNSSVAFRYTHKKVTSTGQVLISPVSQRFVMTNRFLATIGSMSRAGTTVTVDIDEADFTQTPFGIGGTVTVSPGETDFPAGAKTLTNVQLISGGGVRLTWTEAGAATSSTADQEMMPGTTGAVYGRASVKLPLDAAAGDIIQLYKSVATSSSAIDPSPDLYLCAEHLITGAEVAALALTIDDYTPQSVLQEPLYTNPTDGDGLGIEGQNFPPPIYADSANFDSRTFFLNTVGQQYLKLQLLGVGTPDGVQENDTITFNDTATATATTYTFKAAPGTPTEVRLITNGSPSWNIAWTTFYLARATAGAGADLRALGIGVFAETSPNGYPGGIRIERTDYLQDAVQVKVSRPASWSPALQSATYTDSFAQESPNGLSYSKLGQPEAVPLLNTQKVGTSNYFGRRLFALKNSLIILKEGDGIWSLTGTDGNYSLLQISTANIIAPDCACVFADNVWAYTDQGILRISDSGGVQVVSRPIETELVRLATDLPAETYAWSYAVGYETERRVMFFLPFEEANDDTNGAPVMKAFCYSLATNAWTGPLEFNGTPVSGLVTTGHKLVTGIYDDTFAAGRLTQERKTDSYLDVADAGIANTLLAMPNTFSAASIGGIIINLAFLDGVRVGDGISQGTDIKTTIKAFRPDVGPTCVEVWEVESWVLGAAFTYQHFDMEVEFLPEGTPAARKALTRLVFLFKPEEFQNLAGKSTLFTDQMQDVDEIDTTAPGYGLGSYGEDPYGDPSPMVVDVNPMSQKWTNAGQFFPGFKLEEVWFKFKLQGVGMKIDNADGPVGRGR